MTADPRREVDRFADEIQAAIKSVGRKARGMSIAEAQKCVSEALGARGLELPDSATREFARSIADPWWPVKHPVAFWKEFQGARREDDVADSDPLLNDPELAWLERRLEKVDQLRSIWAPGPSGGSRVFVVAIDPWSERVARRVRARATPLEVTVRPFS
jgi:hypothetical protein